MRILIPFILVGSLSAQEHIGHGGPAPNRPPADTSPLYRAALGPYERTISTTSPDAQSYFNQGMQQMFAFTPTDAVRSFRAAQRLDPGCAMCAWGEAWSLGAYLNEPMRPANAAPAFAAISNARRLARTRATPVERELIDAMASRYEARHDSLRRRMLDSAYARSLEAAYRRHPADNDVGTLYADALMLLEPRRGTWSLDKPSIPQIHEVLLGVLARDLSHPLACHLLIHATETTPRAALAEPCAERLGSSIPGASHINHMPSHTWNRVGRWGDAVRSNIRAWHSDQRAAYGEAFAIYPAHNLHMLVFAASYDGQGAIAMQAGLDYARNGSSGAFMPALAMVRFGRFAEILRLTDAPGPPVPRGLWAFARGYAHARTGNADSARVYAGIVDSIALASPTSVFRFHTAPVLLGVVSGILRGTMLNAEGRGPEAIAALERAVQLEDSMTYDEPEPLPFSARHWLGALLLEANRAAEAEAVYRAELEDHPSNGWSLFGLMEAQERQGKRAEANETRARFERAFIRADAWLMSSRF